LLQLSHDIFGFHICKNKKHDDSLYADLDEKSTFEETLQALYKVVA